MTVAPRVPNKKIKTVRRAIIKMLKGMLVKTIAFDNGLKFAQRQLIASALNCRIYFCNPGAPQERETNENHNRLLRRFFPKGTDFASPPTNKLLAPPNSSTPDT